MTNYEKAVAIWRQKSISTDAELAEVLNNHSIAFAYHSGKIENDNITYHDTREIFEHDGVTSYTGDLRTLNALTAAAYFHAKFENIHPFVDGNGRVGRLLLNFFLVRHGHSPIVIHEENRKDYYEALEAWDRQQELEPLYAFLREQTAKTWEKQII